jgi:hydrogenase maturation protease
MDFPVSATPGSGAAYGRVRRELVLGLGNELLGDDAVGLLAARRVAERAGERVDHAEACVATLDLLPVIAGYERLIVVDAYLSADDPPGRSIHVTPEALPRGFGYRSFHTLPFREMLEFGRYCGIPMPREVSIHGLCVREVRTFSRGLSPPVKERWGAWAEEIVEAEWGSGVVSEVAAPRGTPPGAGGWE